VPKITVGPAKGKMIAIWFQDNARIGQSEEEKQMIQRIICPTNEDHSPLGKARIKAISTA